MNSHWSKDDENAALERWGTLGTEFALRLYSARLIGRESTLVLHGGGNVSLKAHRRNLFGDDVEVLYVKGSGWDLSKLEPRGLPGVELAHLRRLRSLEALNDEQMVNEIRTHLLDANAPTPSIETLLHAFLPHRYIDHSHADAIVTLTNQRNGEKFIREALADRVAVVPYICPGFLLAKAVAAAYEAQPGIDGIVLLQHGLITFGEDARTSYERHIGLVDACEKFIHNRASKISPAVAFQGNRPAPVLVAQAAPILRGLLAVRTDNEDRPYFRSIMEWRASDEILRFVSSKEGSALSDTSPLVCDHLIRVKPWPMFVDSPQWDDGERLRSQLADAVGGYHLRYANYVTRHSGSMSGVDPSPRIVLLPGAGLLAWGRTKRDAIIAADIAEHTIIAKVHAHCIGSYESLPEPDLFEMEFRGLQQVKLGSKGERALDGQVVVISGGAGAIGSSVAEVCAQAGAHVVLTDLDVKRLEKAAEDINERHGNGACFGVRMDVTDESSVIDGYSQIVRAFGGVDCIVPNAGIAHVAPIEELSVEDFRRVMEVNAVGYFLFMREGIRILKQQGLGGNIIINASKNVFGPGKDFGAYSASKAAGHQLGKVAAIELAEYGIRVNMINADAIFGDSQTPSGLWAEVGPHRAKSRNLREDELQEYYRSRNLLKVRVYGHHVGNAVVFFAGNATPTTGATLPIDGGVIEAFPR